MELNQDFGAVTEGTSETVSTETVEFAQGFAVGILFATSYEAEQRNDNDSGNSEYEEWQRFFDGETAGNAATIEDRAAVVVPYGDGRVPDDISKEYRFEGARHSIVDNEHYMWAYTHEDVADELEYRRVAVRTDEENGEDITLRQLEQNEQS
jgi:hypothetical protein